MGRPSIFVFYDILLGFCTLLTTGLTIYLLSCGIIQFNIIGMMSLISLLFIVFWASSLYGRYKLLKTFTWYPELNMMIQFNGYKGLTDPKKYVNYILDRWSEHHEKARDVFKNDTIWVFFQKDINESVFVWSNKIIKGFVIQKTKAAYVDFDTIYDKVEDTAFAHELGHIIHGFSTLQWNTDEHHKFFAEHGLGRIVINE